MQTCSLKNKAFTGLLPGRYSIISAYELNLVICHLMKTEHTGTFFLRSENVGFGSSDIFYSKLSG